MAIVFMDKIVKRIYESPTQLGLQKAAVRAAEDRLDLAAAEMKQEFDKHEVTREIDRGIGAPNISQTLRGGDAPENLYSFIGFPAGADPTQEIRDRLDPSHPDGPQIRLRGKEVRGTSVRYQFIAEAPKEEKIYKATPLPWAEGLSWAKKIEDGIPGFAKFLAKFMPNASDETSRSKGGTQVKTDVRGAEYVPPPDGYLTTIFRNFLARVRRR